MSGVDELEAKIESMNTKSQDYWKHQELLENFEISMRIIFFQ